MQRRPSKLFFAFATIGVAALVLTGCASAAPSVPPTTSDAGSPADSATSDSETNAQASGSGGEAVFSFGDKKYSAQLDFCSLYDTGDALFHGLAIDEAGNEVGYLDGDFVGLTDSPHGEVRLDFGATGQFQSMDTFVAMGDAVAEIVITDFSEGSLIVMGGVWDENSTVGSTGTLQVKC